MAAPLELVDAERFQQEVLDERDGVVLVDLWSRTCPHCARLAPEFDAAADADEKGVKFVKVAAQDCMEVFRQHNITGVPTLILFKNGEEVARAAGFKTAADIAEWVSHYL